jgi:DNA-binding response OmpR family regulator
VHILKVPGFKLFDAESGEKALAILNSTSIDLVLLDVMMPGMSGLDVLREIRMGSNKKIREVPVMMLTAKASTDDVDAALESGANAYVIKPFRSSALREKVQTLLDNPTS